MASRFCKRKASNANAATQHLYPLFYDNSNLFVVSIAPDFQQNSLHHSEVFKGTQLYSFLAEEGHQRWISENTKFMFPVVRLGKVIWALSTSSLVGSAGISRVNHELCREQRQLSAWTTGSGGRLLSSQGMPQGFLEVGDGHVLAHGGQSKVHIWPPVERVNVGSTMLANLQFEGQ